MTQPQQGAVPTETVPLFAPYRYRRHSAKQAQTGPQAFGTNHPQQPPNVVARRAQHRMELVAQRALQMTAAQPMIGLEVSDHRFDRLASLERLDLERAEPRLLAPVLPSSTSRAADSSAFLSETMTWVRFARFVVVARAK
jgi:hypothetical protein